MIENEIVRLIKKMASNPLKKTSIIESGCPIVSFGDISISRVATVGLNPSNLEFFDNFGIELDGIQRRFHTLHSLQLSTWNEINEAHVSLIAQRCKEYFSRNPYDQWFKKLDYLISGANYSYYFPSNNACHLDLVPFATFDKWGTLTKTEQNFLITEYSDTLGKILSLSPIEFLILNGNAVVESFSKISNVELKKKEMEEWSLPRIKSSGVIGISYIGHVTNIGGIDLNKKVTVFGYNHNIQSSFGVTKKVQSSIRTWVTNNIKKINHV